MTAGAHQAKPDFFERLIDKAIGTEAGIAPRLRSLFEPMPQAAPGSNWLEEPEHDATPAAPAHRSHEAPPPTAQRRMMERDCGPPHDIAGRPAGNEPAAAMHPHGTVFGDAPIDGNSLEPAMALAAVPRVTLDAAHPDGTPPPPRALAAAPLTPRRARTSAPIAPVRRRDPSAQDEAGAGDARTPPQLVPDSRVTIERVFLETPSRVAHRQQPDDRYADPSQAPAAPTVNITIGRVEVRAVSAPGAKPRAEARGPQPLGLDEYLKRRGAR
jgi:hypothetical protein